MNDKDFDVALHLVFELKDAHGTYQEAPGHQQFIDQQQENWKVVRVFDSFVERWRTNKRPMGVHHV